MEQSELGLGSGGGGLCGRGAGGCEKWNQSCSGQGRQGNRGLGGCPAPEVLVSSPGKAAKGPGA